MTVTRSDGGDTATLVLNFGGRAVRPSGSEEIVFDTDAERWGGTGGTDIAPWSARVTQAS
jgi:hypothetical protein